MYNVINMTFGYQQGDSFSQHKQALGFDAGASEQMRLKQIAEQRKKDQQTRAKQDIQSRNIKLRIIKDELARRNVEFRRLEGNVVRLSAPKTVENFDMKIRELRNKIKDIETEIQKVTSLKAYSDKTTENHVKELAVAISRKRMEEQEITKLKTDEHHLEEEIKILEKLAA